MKSFKSLSKVALKAHSALILAVSLFAICNQGFADTLPENTVNIGSQSTPITPDTTLNLSIPKFDSSLGTLTAINFNLDGTVFGSMGMENLSVFQPTFFNLISLSAFFELDTQSGQSLINVNPSDFELVGDSLDPFNGLTTYDGTTDFSGTSGVTFNNIENSSSAAATNIDSGVLALFTGSGNIDLVLDITDVSFAVSPLENPETSPDDYEFTAFQFNTSTFATLGVEYEFTPAAAPGAVPFGFDPVIGLSIIGAAGSWEIKRRRRRIKK